MRRSRFLTVPIVLTGMLAMAPSAQAAVPAAAPAPASVAATCDTWISGEWGHGKCTNNAAWTRTMWIHVECDAWWDSNVDKEVPIGNQQTIEMQGHCYSSVSWVTAGIK
jgi:hypothetical protein